MKKIFFIVLIFFFVDSAFGQSFATGITYTANAGQFVQIQTTGASQFNCGGGFQLIAGKQNPKPQSVQEKDSCQLLYAGAFSYEQNDMPQEAYDTAKRFIESCANTVNSFHAFNVTSYGVQYSHQGDTTRYDHYRDWLISVLYLNTTNPLYFCADLGAIIGTYAYGKWHIPNAGLAVIKFLLANPHCNSQGLQDDYNNTVWSRHNMWLEGDTTKPEDTTLPSLDQLGLGFLLKSTVSPSNGSTLSNQYLASFASSPNPFIKETTLQFTLNRMTYTTVVVYDELGRLVWGDGKGSSLEAGEHTIHLDASNFPSGTLYARISTGFGEVKTVKLVHEK